jgi:hypothetical protein
MANINPASWVTKTADQTKKSVLIAPNHAIIQRNDKLNRCPQCPQWLQPFHFCSVVRALFHKSWQAHADALEKLQEESFFHFAVCDWVTDLRQLVNFNHN